MGNSSSVGLQDDPKHKAFNKKNSTSGLKLSNKHNTISQNDYKIRSILATQIVNTNQTFYWNFSIDNWSGRCCRFGIVNPQVKAKGSIWSQPGAICVCISPGCWGQLWGASNNTINPTHFRNKETIGIKISNTNNKCSVSFYRNNKPIENAIDIQTSFSKACFFWELCGPVKVSLIQQLSNANIKDLKPITEETKKQSRNSQMELLISGYVSKYIGNNVAVPKDILSIIIEFYKLLFIKIFDSNNYSKGIALEENDTIISQKVAGTKSILGTQIVENGQLFHWTFKIDNWAGRCCRFGIINPEMKAQGCIWSKPGAICMCIFHGCWKCLWGARSDSVITKNFKSGETVGIKIENKINKCYVTFYHNNKPIPNAIDIETQFSKGCMFFELCGPVKVSVVNSVFKVLKTKKQIEKEIVFDKIPFDVKIELLVNGFLRKKYETKVIPKVIAEIMIEFYKLLCWTIFDKNNCTFGLKLDENDTIISQNDNQTRSVLCTQIVNNNETFYWKFKIDNWSGRCCRFGIMNPEMKAQGSIWSKPGAICMCVYSGCWKCLWGARSDRVNTEKFKSGETVGIKIANKNNKCYVSWYHNNEPIPKATDIPTIFAKACLFFELCGAVKVSLIEQKAV